MYANGLWLTEDGGRWCKGSGDPCPVEAQYAAAGVTPTFNVCQHGGWHNCGMPIGHYVVTDFDREWFAREYGRKFPEVGA